MTDIDALQPGVHVDSQNTGGGTSNNNIKVGKREAGGWDVDIQSTNTGNANSQNTVTYNKREAADSVCQRSKINTRFVLSNFSRARHTARQTVTPTAVAAPTTRSARLPTRYVKDQRSKICTTYYFSRAYTSIPRTPPLARTISSLTSARLPRNKITPARAVISTTTATECATNATAVDAVMVSSEDTVTL